MRPEQNEYGEFYSRYIELATGDDPITALLESAAVGTKFWSEINEEQACYRYAEDKWSIKELLQHLIDSERVFCYRAMAFARGESTALPGYEENDYAQNSLADSRTFDDILEEYKLVRASTIALFKSFDNSVLKNVGKASGSNMSVRSAGFVIVGHELHHVSVVKERYLNTKAG